MGSNGIKAAGVNTCDASEKFACEEVERNMALTGGEGLPTKPKALFVAFVLNRRILSTISGGSWLADMEG